MFQVDANANTAEVIHVVASPHPLPVTPGTAAATVSAARRTRGVFVAPAAVHVDDAGQPWYGDPESSVEGFGALLSTLVLDHE